LRKNFWAKIVAVLAEFWAGHLQPNFPPPRLLPTCVNSYEKVSLTDYPMKTQSQDSREIAEKLFTQFADRLFAFATLAWRFSEDEAWEAIYETIFHIAKVYHRYEFPDDRRLANFVITVFNNRLKNLYRSKQSGPIHIEFQESEEHVIPGEVETSLNKAETAVSQALEELEDWERILLIQRTAHVPYSEIEKLVNKPGEQLKVYYKRVLAKLEKRVRLKLSMEQSDEK